MSNNIVQMHYKVAFAFLFTLLIAIDCIAEPVQQSHNGLLLNAKTNIDISELANKRVFLIVHGTLAHNGMEIIESLLSILQEEGEAALALTLSLNINDRKGMFPCDIKHTHQHEDALAEIGLWLDWLSAQGATSVVLIGHSRGSIQVADYLAKNQDKRVQQAVLIAPPTASKGTPKEITVQADTGNIKVETFLHCASSSVTTSSYASYYGEHPTNTTLKTIATMQLPVLLFLGSEDRVVKAKDWMSSTPLPANIQLNVIPGADHFFRDLYAYEIVEQVIEWVE